MEISQKLLKYMWLALLASKCPAAAIQTRLTSRLSLNPYVWHSKSPSINNFQRGYVRCFQSSGFDENELRTGDKIQVEVISFGPLGATVALVGLGHEGDLLTSEEDPYATGLILQKEIAFFREARNNLDVVRGEILPAYVQHVREDGKVDVGLRVYGGKAKAEEVSAMILDRLQGVWPESLLVGDKSPPKEISTEFPGVSKTTFKKAVGSLYKKGLIEPKPNSITLTEKGKR